MGFTCSSASKESICKAGDLGLIPELERSPGEGRSYSLQYSWASLVAQLVKNPSAMWEIWIQFLAWEDPLENEIATRSVFWPGEFSCLQSFPASESFPVNWLFASGGQTIRASASAPVPPKNIQGQFLLGMTGLISLLSKGLSTALSRTTV